MGRGPLGIVPLGSIVVLYVGPLRCGWRGRGVAQRPVVWQGGDVGVWGLGVVILVVLAEGQVVIGIEFDDVLGPERLTSACRGFGGGGGGGSVGWLDGEGGLVA